MHAMQRAKPDRTIIRQTVAPSGPTRQGTPVPLVLLTAVAVASALVAGYLVARRRVPACAHALADTAHFSLDWLTAYELRPLQGGERPAPPTGGWQTVVVEGLSAAEDLLDALEAAGCEEQELLVLGDSAFAVRWR
jgi:hypothetical protein